MARKPVDIFTREQFEDALPKLKADPTKPAWKSVGLDMGEYTYLIPLGDKPAQIMVRSSVDSSGKSASSGEDSIRCYIVDKDRKFLGAKISRWTTRLPGWKERMLDIIHQLAKMAVKVTQCPKCDKALLRVFKVKKEGPNKGRFFLTCKTCNDYFEWLDHKDSDDDKPEKKAEPANPPCPDCGGVVKRFTVKKEGPNKGRAF